MFFYDQGTGQLRHIAGADCQIIGTGYSGNGKGLNNPNMQNVPDVGPIPRGTYTIGNAETHPKLGPLAMPLIPQAGTDAHGRSGFFMHGDNVERNFTASEGCIVMPLRTRISVSAALERTLKVG